MHLDCTLHIGRKQGDLSDEDEVFQWILMQKEDESIQDINRETFLEYSTSKDFLAVVWCEYKSQIYSYAHLCIDSYNILNSYKKTTTMMTKLPSRFSDTLNSLTTRRVNMELKLWNHQTIWWRKNMDIDRDLALHTSEKVKFYFSNFIW